LRPSKLAWLEAFDQTPDLVRANLIRDKLIANQIEAQFEELQTNFEDLSGLLNQGSHAGAVQTSGLALPVRLNRPVLVTDQNLAEWGRVSAETLANRVVDCLIPDESSRLWPHNLLSEAFFRLVSQIPNAIDLDGGVLLNGAGPVSMAAIIAFARLGYRKFSITDLDEQRAMELIRLAERVVFRSRFDFVPRTQILHLGSAYSVVLNTIRVENDPSRLSELIYFNFLKSQAIWIEYPLSRGPSVLIHEAQNANAHVLSSVNLVSYWDQTWIERLSGVRVDAHDYGLELTKRLAEHSPG